MKIFAVIGNNSATTESEYLRPLPKRAVWYEIPDSAILRSPNPFFIPDSGSRYVAFPSLALRIGKLGKSVAERFAERYFDAIAPAVTVIAVDILFQLRHESLPWSRAVAFDRSCILGNFEPISALEEMGTFVLKHGYQVSKWCQQQAPITPGGILSMISADNTVKTGDVILYSVSACGVELRPGFRLSVSSGETNLIDINVK